MTHTGGLRYVLNPTSPVDRLISDQKRVNANAPLQTMIDGLAKVSLLAPLGTRWSYIIAVDVQCYLVEALSGQPFADFTRQRIFAPLGINDTAFYVPSEKLPRTGPTLAAHPNRPALGPSGGGLYSTAMDYTRFCEMLLAGGHRRKLVLDRPHQPPSSSSAWSSTRISRPSSTNPPSQLFN